MIVLQLLNFHSCSQVYLVPIEELQWFCPIFSHLYVFKCYSKLNNWMFMVYYNIHELITWGHFIKPYYIYSNKDIIYNMIETFTCFVVCVIANKHTFKSFWIKFLGPFFLVQPKTQIFWRVGFIPIDLSFCVAFGSSFVG
jgi:hypothetical protein